MKLTQQNSRRKASAGLAALARAVSDPAGARYGVTGVGSPGSAFFSSFGSHPG